MTHGVTPHDVAAWMLKELHRQKFLSQDVVVYKITRHFGEEFTYINASGNLAIGKAVLDAFRKLSGDKVVWSRSERHWRSREQWDLPG